MMKLSLSYLKHATPVLSVILKAHNFTFTISYGHQKTGHHNALSTSFNRAHFFVEYITLVCMGHELVIKNGPKSLLTRLWWEQLKYVGKLFKKNEACFKLDVIKVACCKKRRWNFFQILLFRQSIIRIDTSKPDESVKAKNLSSEYESVDVELRYSSKLSPGVVIRMPPGSHPLYQPSQLL